MARPRADDYHEKRKLILDGAAILFAEKGFAGTSINSIAQFCNTSKALIYHYYQSKEAMLFDMLHSHVNLLLDTAMEMLHKEADSEKQLRQLLRSFMQIYVASHAKHVVLLNDLHWLPEPQQKCIREIERSVVKIFRDLVFKLRPDLNEKTRLGLAMALLGSVNWTYIWFKDGGSLTPDNFADLAATLFFDGVNGISGHDSRFEKE
jgi:TetR/AcrR family transcriptional regulator